MRGTLHGSSSIPGSVSREGGFSLVELMVALVVLSIGVLALAQLFPQASRGEQASRMLTTANYYAQEKVEELSALPWTDAALTAGHHPAGTATESLGKTGAWQRFYIVTTMAAPMADLKRVDVTVSWKNAGAGNTTLTTYVRR